MKKISVLNWLLLIVAMFAIGLLASFSYFSYILWIGGGQNLTKVEEKHVYLEEPKLAEAADRVAPSLLLVVPKSEEQQLKETLNTLPEKCFLDGAILNGKTQTCLSNLEQGLIYTSDGIVIVWFEDLKKYDSIKDWRAMDLDGKLYDLEKKEKLSKVGVGLVKFKIWKDGDLNKKETDREKRYNWPILDLAKFDQLKIGQQVFVGVLSPADQNLILTLGNIVYLDRSSKVSDENKNELIFSVDGIRVEGNLKARAGNFLFDVGGQLVGVLLSNGLVGTI